MNGFENRQVDHINRKRLNVVSGNYTDDGKIVSLVVDVVREDGYKDGDAICTRFDKESMENAMIAMFYDKVYALNFSSDVLNLLEVNSDRVITITPKTSGLNIYPKLSYDGGMKYAVATPRNNTSGVISVNFSFNPDYQYSYEEYICLELYTDVNKTNLHCVIPIKIYFTPSSTGSGD